MNSNTPRVSIVTVNYYSEKDILNSLVSIVEKTEEIEFEYIIVSNSPLKSDFKESALKIYDQVIFYQMADNVGFATACNKGSNLASGEFIFFLNPDTFFRNNALYHLISFSESLENDAIVGPKTFNQKGNPSATLKSDVSKEWLNLIAFPFLAKFQKLKPHLSHYSSEITQTVDVVNGHALFMRKSLFEELDGMDESFFMYWEEHDLALRARQKKCSVYFLTEAEVVHLKGTSTSSYFIRMEIENHKSLLKYLLKHSPDLIVRNKYVHLIGYSWRLIAYVGLLNKRKIKLLIKLINWYLFKYNGLTKFLKVDRNV